jgi:hypothetical protein
MNTIATKVESILAWIKSGSNKDENVIDLQKTFSAAGIDILPVVIKILELEAGFPTSQIQSKDGIKYHELEFFQANLSSSSNSNNNNTTPNTTLNTTPNTTLNTTLNVDNNSTAQESLFTRLDRTHTTLGSTLLKSMILQPYHTQEQIRNIVMNRQRTVLQLVSNLHATTQIRDMLNNLQIIEKDLLAMSLADTPEMEEVYKIIFFEMGPLKYLNYNTTFLKIFYYFMIIFSPMYGIISPFIFIFAPFLFMKYILKIPIPIDAFWNIMKKMLFGGTGFMTMLDKMFNSQIGAGMQSNLNGDGGVSIKGTIFWLVRMLISLLNSSVGGYAYIAFIVVSYVYGIYNSLQVSITFNKIINMFHSRMNILAKWMRDCMQLFKQQVCFDSVELAPVLGDIRRMLGDELVQMLLENNVFTKEPGLISDKGIIIKCFRLFLDVKKQGRDIIAPFARYVAHVDVMTALATWLREKDDRSPVHFILDGTQPIIQGTDVWNLACGIPIYNDVLLGSAKSLDDKPVLEVKEDSSKPEALSLEVETPEVETPEVETPEIETPEIETFIDNEKQDEINKTEIQESAKEDNNVDINTVVDADADAEKDTIKTSDVEMKDQDTTNLKIEPTGDKSSKKSCEHINNVIITGPNGSGKSTYIKSITECVILAQTLGLAPAREFRLTPFKHISTYLNIPDCQGKESLFQAEMNRCYQQLETLREAEEAGEFSFNIMDEIFVSTNYQEGMSGAYAVINQLCRFNKCLNIITTHFDKLANLEDLPVGRKYFDVDIQEDGQVIRDYKIREGVSRKHMALRLLKSRGFSEQLVKDAETFYEKLQH